VRGAHPTNDLLAGAPQLEVRPGWLGKAICT
jgi:hypothetical protein